jgi:hypothetical protein
MSGTNPEGEKDARRRMEARAKLDDPGRPPNFIMTVVKPRWENGRIVQPPIRLDSRIARVGNRTVHREPNETYDQFYARVASYLPVNGLPGYATMEPTEDELPENPSSEAGMPQPPIG